MFDPRYQWQKPFTHVEAVTMWSRLVAGWAHSLDDTGALTLMNGVSLPNFPDQGGSFEGVARMMWGIGGWLSQSQRPTSVSWRGETFDLVALMKRAYVNGCDPSSPGSWGKAYIAGAANSDQRTVETGNTMFNLWQARETVWATMTPAEQERVVRFHELFGQRPPRWSNNWSLFWLMNHAARKALCVRYDQMLINSVLDDYVDSAYCGDGWYDDGAVRGAQQFDDYNWWVFGTHLLTWAFVDGDSRPEKRATYLERTRALMQHYPYFFAANGAYTEYGRSLAYKFARLGVALWAYKMGAWPYSTGMLKRLVGRHLRWYFDRGAVAADGTLIQPITAQGSATVRDPYISTGSTYWAMQAFSGLWSLSDNDPLWSVDEEPLPVEQSDFVKVFPQPGWVLVGTQATGEVQRFNAGSTHRPPEHHPAKYDKFVYSTAAPFNAGLINGTPAPDAMLELTDGRAYGHRFGNLAFAVGEPGWLRMRYTQTVGGGTHTIDTTMVCRGEAHLRAHRIALDSQTCAPIAAVEGAAALGYAPGMIYDLSYDDSRNAVFAVVPQNMDRGTHGRAVAIRAVRGYTAQSSTSAWGGHSDINVVYGVYILPMLTVAQIQPMHELICVVHIGGSETIESSLALAGEISGARWLDDGTFELAWRDGTTLQIPSPGTQS